jgi:hypothetical protein
MDQTDVMSTRRGGYLTILAVRGLCGTCDSALTWAISGVPCHESELLLEFVHRDVISFIHYFPILARCVSAVPLHISVVVAAGVQCSAASRGLWCFPPTNRRWHQ